jgi:hypothetical protein
MNGDEFLQLALPRASSFDVDASRAPPLSAPAIAGEGDHWSSHSERTVVEGAPGVELRFRCKKFSLQEEASERTCPDITETLAAR